MVMRSNTGTDVAHVGGELIGDVVELSRTRHEDHAGTVEQLTEPRDGREAELGAQRVGPVDRRRHPHRVRLVVDAHRAVQRVHQCGDRHAGGLGRAERTRHHVVDEHEIGSRAIDGGEDIGGHRALVPLAGRVAGRQRHADGREAGDERGRAERDDVDALVEEALGDADRRVDVAAAVPRHDEQRRHGLVRRCRRRQRRDRPRRRHRHRRGPRPARWRAEARRSGSRGRPRRGRWP